MLTDIENAFSEIPDRDIHLKFMEPALPSHTEKKISNERIKEKPINNVASQSPLRGNFFPKKNRIKKALSGNNAAIREKYTRLSRSVIKYEFMSDLAF